MTSQPQRIQRKRSKGWKMPPNMVYVGRPSKWGNPYRVGQPIDMRQANRWGWDISPSGRRIVCATAEAAAKFFSYALFWDSAIHDCIRQELGGKNLACWCDLAEPCHADSLLQIANSTREEIAIIQQTIDERMMGHLR